MGFEPGSEGNWDKVQKFLKKRQGYRLPERIHAIWWGPTGQALRWSLILLCLLLGSVL